MFGRNLTNLLAAWKKHIRWHHVPDIVPGPSLIDVEVPQAEASHSLVTPLAPTGLEVVRH
jgi:hypothetical protein